MKEKINKWYKQGLWNEEMITNAITKGKITEEEKEEILKVSETKEGLEK